MGIVFVQTDQANTWTVGTQQIETGAAGTVGLVVKAAAGQSEKLTNWETSAGVALLSVQAAGHLQFAEAVNIVVGTTTGTQIGTAAAQKIGFFGATPVVQRAKAAHGNWAALANVVQALVELGLFDAA